MKLIRGLAEVPYFKRGTVAIIGNFDGVHLGHQALLTALRAQAHKRQLPMTVLLFEPQPAEYFQQNQAPPRLTSLREKLAVLKSCKVDYVVCLKFNKAFSLLTAEIFAERYLFSWLKAKYILIGEGAFFGQGRQGDISLLQAMGKEEGCLAESFTNVIIGNQRVSSTRIRDALAQGQLNEASALLGRSFSLCGRVIRGNQRGREWGIPTANLALHRATLPLHGVFCVRVRRVKLPMGKKSSPSSLALAESNKENTGVLGEEWLHGVANLGTRPTVDGTKNILEIHLFNFNEEVYGEMLQVFFLHKIRDEVKFLSLDALIRQIHDDIRVAKTYCYE